MKRRVQRGRDSWFVLTCADVGVQMETHAESFQFKQCETLKSHLELLGIGDYIAVFNAARIDMVLFKGMTEEDLREAGIKDGPICVIMNERNQVVTCLISSRSTPQTVNLHSLWQVPLHKPVHCDDELTAFMASINMSVKEFEFLGVESMETLKALSLTCLETMLGIIRTKMLLRKLHETVRTSIRRSETLPLKMQSPSADPFNI